MTIFLGESRPNSNKPAAALLPESISRICSLRIRPFKDISPEMCDSVRRLPLMAICPRNGTGIRVSYEDFDYEKAFEDPLGTRFKGTLGKVNFFSTSGACMLLVKLV